MSTFLASLNARTPLPGYSSTAMDSMRLNSIKNMAKLDTFGRRAHILVCSMTLTALRQSGISKEIQSAPEWLFVRKTIHGPVPQYIVGSGPTLSFKQLAFPYPRVRNGVFGWREKPVQIRNSTFENKPTPDDHAAMPCLSREW